MRLQQKNHIANFRFAPQMWATLPHLASIFEKLLDQKTFCCLRLIIQNHDSFDLLLDFCCSFIHKSNLLRKCGLLAHTSAAFLKNCCIEKLFICASHLLNRKPPLPIREKRFQMLFCLMRFGIRSDCFLCQFCLFLQFSVGIIFQKCIDDGGQRNKQNHSEHPEQILPHQNGNQNPERG